MSNAGSAFGMLGGAVADLFGASGSKKAGAAYGKAAGIADSNAALSERSTAIQETQQNLLTYKAIGTENADVAGAGFTQGGSAGDLLRSSAQQASLSKQLIATQGQITAQGYTQQANAYRGQEDAAKTQAKGQGAGGIMGIIGAGLSLFGI